MSANIMFLTLARKLSQRMSIDDRYLSLSLILSVSYKGSLFELNQRVKDLLARSDLGREEFIFKLEKILFNDNTNSNLRSKFDSIVNL
ncbi:MAG: hypothetical protein HON23_00530 [Rickettsiales bacterium]|jgi:hypothetical protein|nr:hypothetical protein [Rickettsiales bacterium]